MTQRKYPVRRLQHTAVMSNTEQTRIQLSQAARRLVGTARHDIGAADVAAAAALPPTSIAQAYGDFDTLLCELLGQMYDEIRDLIARMTLNMPIGRSRLKLSIDAYLQARLERPGLRVLANRLRSHAQGATVIRKRNHGFGLMLQLELKTIGWQDPDASARLVTAAIIDIVVAEGEAGRPLPALRETLLNYFDTGTRS